MKPLLSLLIAFGLSGCISLIAPATKLPPRYTLNASEQSLSGERYSVTLAIADARAEGALNTSKIAVRTASNELRYLSDGDWSDRAPLLFSLLIERNLERRGQLLAVSDRVALPIADYTLYPDVSALNIDRTRTPTVGLVDFRLRLEGKRGRVLGTRRFQAEQVLGGKSTREATTAINQAANEATGEAVTWALDLIAADQP